MLLMKKLDHANLKMDKNQKIGIYSKNLEGPTLQIEGGLQK